MQVTTLTLCDAANVREGLLSVLGGGISFLMRGSYPAPLLCDVGVTVTGTVPLPATQMTISLREAGKKDVLAEIVAEGSPGPDDDAPKGDATSISLAIDAREIAIPKAGQYVLTVSLSEGKGSAIVFTARESAAA